MSNRSIILFILTGGTWFAVPAQDSLSTQKLNEIVVTATRNEKALGALPMPVTLIGKNQLRTMGSLRLNNVLTEQTGLVMVPQVNGLGNGLQLQGFDPDYTLILIDGEPLIGRYTGSLDLSRLAVGNIKQIEIVKGPSSSLYGSEALAGVVNIITERPAFTRGTLSARYGTFNTTDFTGDLSTTAHKLGVYAFANRYSTDGYSLGTNTNKTVSPFINTTLQGKINYKITPQTDLSFSARSFQENQAQSFVVNSNSVEIQTIGTGTIHDSNIFGSVEHHFSKRLKALAKIYTTHYETATNLKVKPVDTLYYHDDFSQSYTRPEINTEYFITPRHIVMAGTGTILETVQTSRYGDENKRLQQTQYGFFQYEWLPSDQFQVIGGGRYDHNSIYGAQFSPKLSMLWNPNNRFTLKASYGLGFKSPDFRQLYLNFNNTAAGGYSVLGTEIVVERINQLKAQGQLGALFYDLSQIGKLQAEQSRALNVGGRYTPSPGFFFDVNIFRNDIDNLIETQVVARTTANQNIYSYKNLHRVYTDGLELNVSYPLFKNISASLGYQLLYAKDKDVIANIRSGGVYSYYRDPATLETKRLSVSEYFGLANRSRHTGNFKIFYNNKERGLDASLRLIYRGRYGAGSLQGNVQGLTIPPSDRNNNGILDVYDNFVSGYFLCNVSAAKTFRQKLRVQAGVDNLFDYKDALYIPNLPGRQIYFSMSYSFSKK